MTETTIDQLIRIDTQLSRSFAGAVAGLFANIIWTFFIAKPTPTGQIELGTTAIVLGVLQLALYIWYAKCAGAAATAIGESGWKYVVWILAAPFLSRLPIPIVSMLIGASPLAIKFLLSAQLQSAIRAQTVSDIHSS
jgi:hypothetical protein